MNRDMQIPPVGRRYYDREVGHVSVLPPHHLTGQYEEKKLTEKFIRGPIPYNWMRQANSLAGDAGKVGLALWFLAGVQKTKTVKVTKQSHELAGCTRQTFSNNLHSLEKAGLVTVERKPGSRPYVNLLIFTTESGG